MTRATQSYSPAEVNREYQLLRRVIFDVLESDLAQRSSTELLRVIRLVDETLDGATAIAFQSYEEERDQLLLREQRARNEAEAANRLKDEFLATLSHELRTPLNAVLGWAQLLRSRNLEPHMTARALETIERNAKSQAKLIDDLLDVSRIINGNLALNVRPVALPPLIEAALEAERYAAMAKGIRVELIVDPSLGLVAGDPDRLQQVVWNLLSNAIKFTPEGGRVEVRVDRVDSRAQIQVSDTGKGISAEFLPYVFERFRQADNTTTRVYGGLGLGLAIVRHLVELHGGTVKAESPGEGWGSSFTVKLPLVNKRDANRPVSNLEYQSSALNRAGAFPPPPPPTLKGARVLIVDDNRDTREYLTAALQSYGAEVTVFSSAAEAFQAVQELQPNVIVSDIGMPDEDGYSLLRKVRALPVEQGGRIAAVALTAYARQEDQRQTLEAGFQRHLTKPIEVGVLASVIADLLELPA
ncbi:response regulator [Leptolyngbya sp. FACHB-261]|nr:response regulator [Leptolyngbya sp. FACHB-261]